MYAREKFVSELEKRHYVVVTTQRVALQMEVEMNREIIEVVISAKWLGSCFSKIGGPQESVEIRVNERLKAF